jgi:hypothetical protein
VQRANTNDKKGGKRSIIPCINAVVPTTAPKIPSSFVEEIKNMDYVGFTGGLASHLPGIS